MHRARLIVIGTLVSMTAFAASPAFAKAGTADLAVASRGFPQVGSSVVSATGAGETIYLPRVVRWGAASFSVTFRNLSDHPVQLRIVGRRVSHSKYFRYELRRDGRSEMITSAITGGGYITGRLAPGASGRIYVSVFMHGGSASGFVKAFPVGGGSADAVRVRIGNP